MRIYCDSCHYPTTICLCAHISKIDSPAKVLILQHPKEVKHAKNTARLVPLCLTHSELIVGKNQSDFDAISQQLNPEKTALIYPTDRSVELESAWQTKQPKPETLIFIDASWRQAYGIWRSTPWLAMIPQYHFSQAPKSQYHIRHTKLAHSLSTLEAVAYSLKVSFNLDTQPMMRLLASMQEKMQMPKAHFRTN